MLNEYVPDNNFIKNISYEITVVILFLILCLLTIETEIEYAGLPFDADYFYLENTI